MFSFLALARLSEELNGTGEFYESDTLFFDDNQIWLGTCVGNVRWNSRWLGLSTTLRVGRSANSLDKLFFSP